MDVKEFLESGYQFVWQLLADEGEFPPFLRILDRHDNASTVIAEDGLVETLHREIAMRASTIEIVALFTMARVENPGEPAQPIILVDIDVRNGPKKLAVTPFRREGGRVQIGQPAYRTPAKRLLPMTTLKI